MAYHPEDEFGHNVAKHPAKGIGKGHGSHARLEGESHTPASMSSSIHTEHRTQAGLSVYGQQYKASQPSVRTGTTTVEHVQGKPLGEALKGSYSGSSGAGLSIGGPSSPPAS